MGMTRSADFYSPLPGCERIASTDRSARSTANRSTSSSHSPTSSSSVSASSSPSSIGSPSALLSPSVPSSVSSSSSSSSSSSFLRHRQEGVGGGAGRLLLDPLLPLHGGETKRAELPEVVLTEVAQLVGHPSTARVLLHNTNKSSYTHLPLPSLSTAPFSTAAYSTGNSTVSTGFTAEHLPASSSISTSTSASVASSIMNGRLGDDEIRQCKSNSHSSGGINGRPTHLVSLSSSGTELHHVGMKHSSHIPLPLSRTPSPLEEKEGSAKFGLSDSYSPDCSPPGSPNLNQNRRLSEPCSSLSPLPSPRTSQNMSLSRSATIDLTAEEESNNENEESKKRSTHSIGFICNNNNMDISSDSDSSPSMSTKNNNSNNNNNRSAAAQPNENSRGGYFLTVISGGSLPGETETRQTIRVGSGPWKVAVVPVCPIARARLLRRRALLAARFGNTGGTSSPPPSTEPQERESHPEQQKQQQIQSHHHHHRHYHHYHNQSSHHPQCQHLHNALRQHHQHQHQQQQQQQNQQQQHQQHQQQLQNVQRSPMAKRSSLSQVQSLRLPSRHNSGVPPVVQNIKSLSRSREIELKKQRHRLGQSGTLEVLANAVTDLHMHESKLS